jgi:hypothetical protein
MRLRGSLFCSTNDLHVTQRLSGFLLGFDKALQQDIFPWLALGLVALLLTVQFPHLLGLMVLLMALAIRFSAALRRLPRHPLFVTVGGWKTVGILVGVLLFAGISMGADPALAIFDKAEQQATSIFGEYIDGKIITFLFGLLRIVVWISAVGFILFAVYQAQRGEQWQPLMQNAFIVIAAIVVVEGLSSMFFK